MSTLYTSDFISLRTAPWAVFALLALGACHRQAPPAAPPALVLASPCIPIPVPVRARAFVTRWKRPRVTRTSCRFVLPAS